MCGLGPAVTMLTALNSLSEARSELIKYATSADAFGDRETTVGYAGIIFG
jgi:AmmeMemoRadiSam system protein B